MGSVQFKFDTFVFNSASLQLKCADQEVELRGKVASLLLFLLQNRGRIVSKDEAIEHIWGNLEVVENSLSQLVKELRTALGDDSRNPRYIKTVPRRGFLWVHEETAELVAPTKPEVVPASSKTGNDKPTDERNQGEPTAQGEEKRFKKDSLTLYFVVAAVFLIGLTLAGILINTNSGDAPIDVQAPTTSVAILPIVNKTENENNAWVELGLAEIIAGQLVNQGVYVLPFDRLEAFMPAIGSDTSQNMDALSIQSLFNETKVDFLLQVEFIQAHDEFSLTAQLSNAEGESIRINFIVDELLAALPPLTKGLLEQFELPFSNDEGISWLSTSSKANEDYAKGVQALHTEGAYLSQSYFEAALVRDPNFAAAKERLAESLFRLAKWSESRALWQTILEAKDIAESVRMNALTGLGKVAVRNGRYDDAKAYFDQVLNSEAGLTPENKRAANLYLAEISRNQDDYRNEEIYLDYANAVDLGKNAIIERAGSLLIEGVRPTFSQRAELEPSKSIAWLYYFRHGSAIWPIAYGASKEGLGLSLDKALVYYESVGHKAQQARTLLNKHYLMIDPTLSMALLKDAYSLYKGLNYSYELTDVLYEMSNSSIRMNAWEEALEYVKESVNIASKLDDPVILAMLHRRLAMLELVRVLRSGDESAGQTRNEALMKARDTALKGIEHASRYGGVSVQADNRFVLAAVEYELGNLDEARQQLSLAAEVYKQNEDGLSLFACELFLARIQLDQGDWQGAAELLETLHQRYQSEVDIAFLGRHFSTLLRLSLFYQARSEYELGNFQKAVEVLYQAQSYGSAFWLEDRSRLQTYLQAASTNQASELGLEENMYLIFAHSFR